MLDLATLKAYLNVTDNSQDTRLQLIVDATNDYVESITRLNYGADKTRTEVHDYKDNIYLDRMGVKSITSIKLYQTGTETEPTNPLVANSYTFNKVGRLTLDQTINDDYSRDDYNSVHVTYVYGKDAGDIIPNDLKLAALQYASEFSSATAGSDSRRVKSESTGSYRIEFTETSTITDVFNRYRAPRI